MGINHLPPELICRICELVPRKHLASVARVSKLFNAVSSTLIYQTITLTNSDKAFICCRILATSPRNLAGYVQTFSIDDFPPWNFTDWHRRQFREWLITSINKMEKLLHFRCMLIGSFAHDMSMALSRRKSLRSLAISFPHYDPWATHSSPSWTEDAINPIFPNLESFAFTYSTSQGPLCPMYLDFILHILRAHATHLRDLRLPDWLSLDNIHQLFPPDVILPALTSLTILFSALDQEVVQHFPNLRSLTFPKFEDISNELPKNAFPHLLQFSGSCLCFKKIMTTDRPLHSVFFDGAVLDMADADIFTQREPPQWRDIVSAIKRFSRCTRPVRALRFYVRSFHVSPFLRAKPFIANLESLIICVRNNVKDVRVTILILFALRIMTQLTDVYWLC